MEGEDTTGSIEFHFNNPGTSLTEVEVSSEGRVLSGHTFVILSGCLALLHGAGYIPCVCISLLIFSLDLK